jgi:hypothetical protein
MNKNLKIIVTIGVVGILLLVVVSMFMLQQLPTVKQSHGLAGHMQILFDLEKIRIAQITTVQGIKYRATIHPYRPLTVTAREKLMAEVGGYLWQHPAGAFPAEVWVVCQEQQGRGCSRECKSFARQIMPPDLKKRP